MITKNLITDKIIRSAVELLEQGETLARVSEQLSVDYNSLRGELISKYKMSIHSLRSKLSEQRLGDEKERIVRMFKKYGSVIKVVQKLKMNPTEVRKFLIDKYGVGIVKLRRQLNFNKYNKSRLSDEKLAKLRKVEEIYNQCGTLEAAGQKLGITRERVRQLLRDGKKYRVIDYVTPSQRKKERLKELKYIISKERLTQELFSSTSQSKLCSSLNISIDDLYKLLEIYGMNLEDYHEDRYKSKWLKEYSKVVEHLGYHPSATELQSNGHWRTINNAILHYWGGLEFFRKQYGIAKPKHRMHPNTVRGFREALKKKSVRKQERKVAIVDFIRNRNIITVKDLYNSFEFGGPSMNNYLLELMEEGKVKIVGKKKVKGNPNLYSLA